MSGRSLFQKNEMFLNFFSKILKIFPYRFRRFLLNMTKNISGKIGIGIRYIIIKTLVKSIGKNVSILTNVTMLGLKNLELGSNVSIHPMCYIDASGGINIGDNVSIAHASTIMSSNHTWDDKSKPIKYNEVTYEPVIIKGDVWIGCGCRILSGVTIKKRSIVAAGAVVNKDVESSSIYGGVPAKFIKNI